ncbi:MAG: SLBB domain-containing protein [Fidelibacterota bacterium]
MRKVLFLMILACTLLIGQSTQELKKKAKEAGVTETQAKEMARQRGMTEAQIEAELKKRGLTKEEGEAKQPVVEPVEALPSEAVMTPGEEGVTGLPAEEQAVTAEERLEEIEEVALESQQQPSRQPLPYFGYDIFQGDPEAFQASKFGAIDPYYNIGPGDEIIIMLWGETQFRQVFNVDREGFIFIPEIGQVFVNGLILGDLETKLFRLLSQAYASLDPPSGKATTYMDVSLGTLRPLRIMVLGEVAQPGAYAVNPTTTLFTSLYYFRGPTRLGSLRDIRLIRGGQQVASIDFYDYLLTGKPVGDVRLQLDDVIFIPPRKKTVSIQGEIKRPAIYELQEGETLESLLTIAGGLRTTAYLDRVQVDRVVPFEKRDELDMDRILVDVDLNEVLYQGKTFDLQDGDQVQLFSVLDIRQNVVTITGASVERPGVYDLGDSLRLSALIRQADSLLGDAYLERADIIRLREDLREELIKVDLGKALAGDREQDILLQPLDRVKIYSLSEMIPVHRVSLEGHVKQPGRYPLLEEMTLFDLIFKGGGFIDEEFRKQTYLQRAELVRVKEDSVTKEIIPFNLGEVLNKKGMADLLLRPDDSVRIYSIAEIEGTTKYVTIEGQVKRPGRYELFEENMTLYDLLFQAGGLDDPVFKSTTFLGRADLLRLDEDRITRTVIPFNLGEVLDHPASPQNLELEPDDIVRVYAQTVFNAVKPVTIEGVVQNPGRYDLKTGMSLKDLILEAGGVDANVYRYKVEVARIDPENKSLDRYAEVVTLSMDEKFHVSEVTAGESHNPGSDPPPQDGFLLQPYDVVSIRPDPYFSLQRQVTITGEVMYPGSYTILSPDEKITDIIERAGGLRPEAYPEASRFTRQGQSIQMSFEDIIHNPRSDLNFQVQDGDEIVIEPQPNLVFVNGEVNNPGIRKYVPGKRLSYYIDVAGGYTPDADRWNVWVQYPNGDSHKINPLTLISPRVMDGSIITVSREPEEEPFDKTEFAKEIASILADLAQVVAIIFLATSGSGTGG